MPFRLFAFLFVRVCELLVRLSQLVAGLAEPPVEVDCVAVLDHRLRQFVLRHVLVAAGQVVALRDLRVLRAGGHGQQARQQRDGQSDSIHSFHDALPLH